MRGDNNSKIRTAKKKIPSVVRDKLYKFRVVPKQREALELIQEDHLTNHDGHNTAETRLNERYLIKGLRKKVEAVGGNNCSVCVPPMLQSRRSLWNLS